MLKILFQHIIIEIKCLCFTLSFFGTKSPNLVNVFTLMIHLNLDWPCFKFSVGG